MAAVDAAPAADTQQPSMATDRSSNGRNGFPRKEAKSRAYSIPTQQQSNVGDLEFDFGLQSDNDVGDAEASTLAVGSGKLSTKKKEALSQVPCKFFRSNGCSAGNSCPFAHVNPGELSSKAICQWFLKGNCRFGHKCALAHILPGQPPSMDRKNKRAQQQQNHNGNGQSQYQAQYVRPVPTMQPHGMAGRGDVLSGMHGFVPFTDGSFGAQDDLQRAQSRIAVQNQGDWIQPFTSDGELEPKEPIGHAEPYGSALQSTSVSSQIFGTSPFSHPGSQSVFYSDLRSDEARPMPTLSSSFSYSGSLRNQAREASAGNHIHDIIEDDSGNAEEFLPSSLSDLLTPVELERRRRSGLDAAEGRGGLNGLASILSSQSVPTEGDLFGNAATSALNSAGAQDHARAPLGLRPDKDNFRGSSARFGGSSNTSAGFLSSRLREELRDEGDAQVSRSGLTSGHATMSHEPGQSLPQGLAAGLSRIHLRSAKEEDARKASLLASSRSRLASDDVVQHALDFGAIGGSLRVAPDDLGPTAPSSIFGNRGTPLHQHFARKSGLTSLSTSVDLPASPGSIGPNSIGARSTTAMHGRSDHSLHAGSPGLRTTQGGIAIPSNIGNIGDATSSSKSYQQRPSNGPASIYGNTSGRTNATQQSTANGTISPAVLPAPDEEVDEAIFELE